MASETVIVEESGSWASELWDQATDAFEWATHMPAQLAGELVAAVVYPIAGAGMMFETVTTQNLATLGGIATNVADAASSPLSSLFGLGVLFVVIFGLGFWFLR